MDNGLVIEIPTKRLSQVKKSYSTGNKGFRCARAVFRSQGVADGHAVASYASDASSFKQAVQKRKKTPWQLAKPAQRQKKLPEKLADQELDATGGGVKGSLLTA